MNTKPQLEHLVARYVEGTCGQKELAELETQLLEDAGNRKYFLDIVLLAEDLGMMNGPIQRRIDVGLPPVEILLQRQSMRTVKVALLAAAAVILVSAVAMWAQVAAKNATLAFSWDFFSLPPKRCSPDETTVSSRTRVNQTIIHGCEERVFLM